MALCCALAASALGAPDDGAKKEKVIRAKCQGKWADHVGTPKADVIRIKGKGNRVVNALGGDDLIIGTAKGDLICGGQGLDRIVAGGGGDTVLGGKEADAITGGKGDDRLLPGGAKDQVSAGPGDDTVLGARGDDRINGGPGNDSIDGQVGSDRLQGGSGNDLVIGENGTDRIFGQDGNDRIDGGPGPDFIQGGAGDDDLETGPGGDTVNGEAGNDFIFGDSGGDVIEGGPGADQIYGGLVDDKLRGGDGNDLIVGGHGVDDMFAGPGDDWMRGDLNLDFHWGGPGNDTVSYATATPPGPTHGLGGVTVNMSDHRAYENPPQELVEEDDPSEWVAETENIVGSNYDDVLTAWKGGRGSATGLGGSDLCLGFTSSDCGMQATETPSVTLDSTSRDPGLLVTGGPGQQTDLLSLSATVNTYVVSSNVPIDAGIGCFNSGATIVSCAKPSTPLGYVTVWGGAGSDVLNLAQGYPATASIVLDGGPGDDTITGSSGDEILVGGPDGQDTMRGGGGDDALFSGPGADTLDGGAGNDQLVTDSACDGHTFIGGEGDGDIAGFAQNLDYGIQAQIGSVATGRGISPCAPTKIRADSEVLEGTQRGDVLIGTPGDDALILGKNGNDVLMGLSGADVLRGERGKDALYGGKGRDELQAFDGIQDIALYCGPGGDAALRDRFDPPGAGCVDRDPTASPSEKARRDAALKKKEKKKR